MTNDDQAVTVRPHSLRVQTGGDQFLVSAPRPELSWQLSARSEPASQFELQAEIGTEVLQHLSVQSSEHLFVSWPWRDLRSTEPVRWRVRATSDTDDGQWSAWAEFEAGLFEGDWTGQWITAGELETLQPGERPARAFTRTFELGPVATSRLYVAALGVYELYVNEVRAGTAELSPGSESFDRTLYAQAYDVTALLQAGRNTVRLVLSDGWFRSRAGAYRNPANWDGPTAIRAELRVGGAQGTPVAIATDVDWDVYETTIIKADLMDGQVQDLTAEERLLGGATLLTTLAPPATWSPAPPVRVIENLAPVTLTRLGPDRIVVDFGQNASGRVRLCSLGSTGERTVLTYGEHVDTTGSVTLSHLDTPGYNGPDVPFRQQDVIISDGSSDSIFEPRHTVHGFRYVQVERRNLQLDASEISMQVLHTDLQRVGAFQSSDPDLNRLWEVADWSFRGNAVDVPTDCPTRERAGWTGDYQIFLPTAVRLYDVDGFTRKWLQSVRDDQLDDGRIVNISPDPTRLRSIPDPGTDMATGSAGWGDAIVIVPWELYRNYGDRQILADCWDAMTRWVDFALNAAASNRHPSRVARSADPLPHEKYVWDGTFHFGEWLEPTPLADDGTPGPAMPDPMAWAMADKGEVGTAYLYRSLTTLADVAEVLGRGADADRYQALADSTRDAWRAEFIDADGRTPNHTQASYVRALTFELAPAELRAAAAQHLVDLIADTDGHLGTGFLSTADLLPVLADTGHEDVAHQLLWQRTTPSWLGMIDRGATTIWEEWEGVDHNGNAHASLNHYSKGAVIKYLHSHILGLRPNEDSTAWNSVTIAPARPPGLEWARGHFDSPQGLIEIDWFIEEHESVLNVTVPHGVSATLSWGSEKILVGAGRHQLRTEA